MRVPATMPIAVCVWCVMTLGGCGPTRSSMEAVYGCYEPTIGPFAPWAEPESGMPEYVVLDSVRSESQPLPHPEGQYVARLPANYEPDFVWYAGWSATGDRVFVDWNRSGVTLAFRLRRSGDTLSGTGVIHTDTQDSVASFPVVARRVQCR